MISVRLYGLYNPHRRRRPQSPPLLYTDNSIIHYCDNLCPRDPHSQAIIPRPMSCTHSGMATILSIESCLRLSQAGNRSGKENEHPDGLAAESR